MRILGGCFSHSNYDGGHYCGVRKPMAHSHAFVNLQGMDFLHLFFLFGQRKHSPRANYRKKSLAFLAEIPVAYTARISSAPALV